MSFPSLILASIAVAIGCLAIARGIVWAMERRSLSERADRRHMMILMTVMVFVAALVAAFETTPH